MDRPYAEAHYRTCRVDDNVDGYSALDLIRTRNSESQCVARITFWDACGQFFVETLGTDVPLAVFEEMIAEAKESIKTG